MRVATTSRRKWNFYLTSRTRVSSSRTMRLKTWDHEALKPEVYFVYETRVQTPQRQERPHHAVPSSSKSDDVPIGASQPILPTTIDNLFVHLQKEHPELYKIAIPLRDGTTTSAAAAVKPTQTKIADSYLAVDVFATGLFLFFPCIYLY